MEDADIIELYWKRSESAISETSKKYGRYCTRIAMNILSNLQDAEECVNSTYLGVWNAIPPNRPRIFSAFIGKITRNIALNYLDARSADRRGEGEAVVAFDELEDTLACDEDDEIREKIDAERLGKLINEYLKTLSKESRMAFIGRYYYFESVKDISKKLKTSESNVRNYLYRAREGLKKYLKKEGIDI